MISGVELDRCAAGHEMSELSKHNTNLVPLGKTGYLQLRSFTFLHCTIYIQSMAAGSSPKVVVLAQLPLL